MIGRLLRLGLALGLLVLIGIQLVPYGRDHANPPVVAEPAWDSERTRELAAIACFDCHSNETTWPWYTNVAPVSWLVQRDVDEGRDELNFSEWGVGEDGEGQDAAEAVAKGEMPPFPYLLTHPAAALSDADRDALVGGLRATLGGEGADERGEDDGEDGEDRDAGD